MGLQPRLAVHSQKRVRVPAHAGTPSRGMHAGPTLDPTRLHERLGVTSVR
jgi:hypothetical protein